MEKEAHDKIMHWVRKCNYEVSGFGKCFYDRESKTVRVISAHLLKQVGGPTVTDIDPTSLSKLNFQLRNNEGELRFWWHSHVNMNAFWSGTDMDTIKQLGGNGWCAAAVFNKKNEYRAAVCGVTVNAFGDKEVDVKDDLVLRVIQPEYPEEIVRAWDLEFTDNVTEKTYEYTKWNDKAWDKGKKPRSKVIDLTNADLEDLSLLAKEARMLGMTLAQYERILEDGTAEEIKSLETELDILFAQQFESEGGINGFNS